MVPTFQNICQTYQIRKFLFFSGLSKEHRDNNELSDEDSDEDIVVDHTKENTGNTASEGRHHHRYQRNR